PGFLVKSAPEEDGAAGAGLGDGGGQAIDRAGRKLDGTGRCHRRRRVRERRRGRCEERQREADVSGNAFHSVLSSVPTTLGMVGTRPREARGRRQTGSLS